MNHYIPGDLESEIREAYRQHVPIDQISARTGIDSARLRAIIGLPEWKPIPESSDCDLWRSDDLKEVL
ncbi:MAG: hypothetical protein ACK526_13965 [Planctomyces sp.]